MYNNNNSYPSSLEDATGSSVVVILGPPGSGRTTAARELVRRSKFDMHEFGALDYGKTKDMWKKTHAVSSKGGLTVQLGLARGVGLIFDDLNTIPTTTKGRRVIRRILEMSTKVSRHLIVIYVANNSRQIPGLRRLCNRQTVRVVKLAPPTPTQLWAMIRNIAGGQPSALKPRSIPVDARIDFRAAIAYIEQHVHKKSGNERGPSSAIVVGEGTRDHSLHTFGIEEPKSVDWAHKLITCKPRYHEMIATQFPQKIAVIHAANVNRILESPTNRIEFARSLAFAARCWSREEICSPILHHCALMAGPLCAPTLYTRSRAFVSRALVTSDIHSLQYKYNKKYIYEQS